MYNKWEVAAWEPVENGEYKYNIKYSGESLVTAIMFMYKLKKEGIGCIRLEWR